MPHALFVNRVYPPADGATGALLAELAPSLVAAGWDVTVLTGPADAPSSEATDNGVRVERVGAARFTRDHTLKRAWAYVSLYPAFVARALRLPSPDVIVTKTDPPMLKVLGPILGRLTGAATVHWAQDLYPEVAEEVGVIQPNGALASMMRRLSTWALRNHDHVVTVGRCMQERVVARGIPEADTSVIPNWPPASVHPVARDANPFVEEHDLADRFVVMYSGNMGLAHPFDAVLGAAAELKAERPEVLVLLVGEGPRKAQLQEQVKRRGLSNVRFLPFQPYDRLAESLSAAHVHLVTMEANLTGLVVPSKLYGALAAGRPALFLGPLDSEAARTIRDHDCGTVLPQPSGSALADAIRTWHDNPDRWAAASERAHGAVATAQDKAARSFDRILRWAAALR